MGLVTRPQRRSDERALVDETCTGSVAHKNERFGETQNHNWLAFTTNRSDGSRKTRSILN
jgi:hypothetical protein